MPSDFSTFARLLSAYRFLASLYPFLEHTLNGEITKRGVGQRERNKIIDSPADSQWDNSKPSTVVFSS